MQGKFHELSIASPAAPLLLWSEAIELHKKFGTRTLWDWIQTLSSSLGSQNLWGMYCWHSESKQGMLAACRTGAPYFVVSSNLCTLYTIWIESSGDAQYVTMQKYFSHPSLDIYFFSNPIHKAEIGSAKRWASTNSNPCAPIDLSSQATVGARFCCAFYQPQQTVQMCWAKSLHWVTPACFDFSSSNFNCRMT